MKSVAAGLLRSRVRSWGFSSGFVCSLASGEGVGKGGWRGVWEGLERGWGRGVGEGLGKGWEGVGGRVGKGLAFCASKALFEKTINVPFPRIDNSVSSQRSKAKSGTVPGRRALTWA